MRMEHGDKKTEAILNECIERIRRGATLEDCLAAYPEYAAELRPLLRTATAVQAAYAVRPREEARAAGRQRLLQGIADAKRQGKTQPASFRMPWRSWAMASALALVMFVGAGVGVVRASNGSVPGEPLYGVKRTVENARLSMPFQSNQAKAQMNAGLAVKRTEEMAALARKRDTAHLQSLPADLQAHMTQVENLSVSKADLGLVKQGGMTAAKKKMLRQRLLDLRARLEQDHEAALLRLQAIDTQVPADFRPKVQQATDRVNRQYQDLVQKVDAWIAALDSSKPAQPPAGQDRQRPAPIRPARVATEA